MFKIELGKKVFGVVFGKGIISSVNKDAYYTFEVEYEEGSTIPYTPEGIPAWNNSLDFRTVFSYDEICLSEFDFSISTETLSPKDIIKLRNKNKLEVKCFSGIWKDVNDCPSSVVEDFLSHQKFFLFRKKI
jgi:hypothetical protein